MRYQKWLGASLGWLITGNPLGGLLGFMAGNYLEKGSKYDAAEAGKGLTELEVNLIVLASHLIKIDGRVSLEEVSFVQQFLNTHFDETLSAKREQVIHHCLQKEYDLNVACDRIRLYTSHPTHVQAVHFLFELAMCDGDLNERENYFIFRVAGYMNVNDVMFRKIKAEHLQTAKETWYSILGVSMHATAAEIRTAYRHLVLRYHPDKNRHASVTEQQQLSLKFQQVQQAYNEAKRVKGF